MGNLTLATFRSSIITRVLPTTCKCSNPLPDLSKGLPSASLSHRVIVRIKCDDVSKALSSVPDARKCSKPNTERDGVTWTFTVSLNYYNSTEYFFLHVTDEKTEAQREIPKLSKASRRVEIPAQVCVTQKLGPFLPSHCL